MSTHARNPKIEQAVRELCRRVAIAEVNLSEAVEARNQTMIEAHGHQSDGFCSYADLVEITDLSRTRIIQIIQPSRRSTDE